MKASFRLLSMAAAIVAMSIAGSAQQPAPGQTELKIGDTAPDFSLPASDGQTYSLAKLKGKYVVLAWFPKAFTAG
jgi:thioredoxin-dependent peroxiredoxin